MTDPSRDGAGVLPRHHRRARRTVLLAAVAGCVAVGAPVFAAPPAGAVSCRAVSGDQLAVVVVVDTGEASPSQRCVVLPARSTGLDALQAAYSSPPVRVEGAGFVCAIGGRPEDGCAMSGGGGQPYWRYWHRTDGRWQYSSVGAGTFRLQAPADGSRCVVEGWSYGTSTSGSTTDAPRVAAGSVSCRFPAPPTTARPAPAVPAQPPPGAVAPGGAWPPGATAPVAPSGDPADSSGVSDGSPPGGSNEVSASSGDDAPGDAPDAGDPDAEPSGEDAGDVDEVDGISSDEDGPDGREQSEEFEDAGAVSEVPNGGGGAPWAGAAIAAVLVAALVAGAVRRSRLRSV